MGASKKSEKVYDLVCIGGGIMSGTLALMTKILDKDSKIEVFERLDEVGLESSDAWNNAGTGHSAFCELNYTPEKEDGSIDISKAISIFSQFERSKEFWNYLVKNKMITKPEDFIKSIPHHSWVEGERDVEFLKKRHEALAQTPMFSEMKFTEDQETLKKWFPLMMTNRKSSEVMAATRMELGTEVNFGELTKMYFEILKKHFNAPVQLNTDVRDVYENEDGTWTVEAKNTKTLDRQTLIAKNIFIGAGGRALQLLQKTGIKEGKGYGGFPVSGEFLFCKNQEVIDKHWAKVYSKAGPDAPPMSTPHLDTRYIDGKRELLFGPFAGFSSKFLKSGSYADLFKTVKGKNIKSLLGAFWHNMDLTGYLVGQLKMSHADRVEVLRSFIKDAKDEDWELVVAGQRVQIIRADKEEWGALQFGTEVVHNPEGTVTALLGASPGASTAVHIMIQVLQHAFPQKMKTKAWKEKLDEMIFLWDKNADESPEEFRKIQKQCSDSLKLEVSH